MQSSQMMQKPLPEGWELVKLGNLIAEAQAGFACGERASDGVIQLRMNNVDTRGNFVWGDFIRVPMDMKKLDYYRLLPNDVLFNNTNSVELVGKTALFLKHDETVVYSNHFTRLRTKRDKLEPAYLSLWLNHQWQAKTFANFCDRWIGQSAFKAEKLFSLEISLPPLHEQQRIAAHLRKQMQDVEAARQAAEAQLKAINQLPAALLRQAFDGSHSIHQKMRI